MIRVSKKKEFERENGEKGMRERRKTKHNEREKKVTFKECYVSRFGWSRCVMLIGEICSTFGIKVF